MSEMTLTIVDSQRSIHGRLHWSMVDAVIGGLAADPETIEELERAVGRYKKVSEEGPVFGHFCHGVSLEPYDAGIAAIDLRGRTVACESTAICLLRNGGIAYHDGHQATSRILPFSIADEWLLMSDISNWTATSEERRWQRNQEKHVDPRDITYSQLADFIVAEVANAMPGLAGVVPDKHGCFDGNIDTTEEPAATLRAIHVRWMMMPRDAFNGKSLRDQLLARHHHISSDINNQSVRWSLLNDAPPGVTRDSWAYRFGGFGHHEQYIYYDLVRTMLWECWDRLRSRDQTETARLPDLPDEMRQFQQEWMHTPQEAYMNMSPAQVVDRERMRLPCVDTVNNGMIDCDCPICQAMADGEFGPAFWHLDGCNMDSDFAFSFFDDIEDWEEEQAMRKSMETAADLDYKASKRKQLQEFGETAGPVKARGMDDFPESFPSLAKLEEKIWKRSYVSPQVFSNDGDTATPLMQLFGIGTHLGELITDLREAKDPLDYVPQLLGAYSDIRKAMKDEMTWLLESNVSTFRDRLLAVAVTHKELSEKCNCLCHELGVFSEHVTRRH